jgi:hypothetical protein
MTTHPDIRRIVLPNSLHLVCRDDTRRYFGDYHLVRVFLSLSIPLEPRFFRDEDERRVARSLLPDPVVYCRSAERMGVPTADVEAVRTVLVDDLLLHAGKYLGSAQFPMRFIQAELTKVRSGKGRKRDFPVFRGA